MPDHPPGLQTFIFPSAGADLVGRIYLGAGDGSRPTCILVHGIPGSEMNYDIAYALRDSGWNAVIWSPRGCWGSGGAYTIAGVTQDMVELFAYLRASEWPIDWEYLTLLGYSLGGAHAVQFVHSQPDTVAALVLLAPVGDFLGMSMSSEFAGFCCQFLSGTDPDALKKGWMQQAWENNPIDLIADLELPLLIIHGDADQDVPAYVVESLADVAQQCEFTWIAGADHDFSNHRHILVSKVVQWLEAGKGA